jgi:hypothetical protein
MSTTDFPAAWLREEPLDPELGPYVHDDGPFGPMLQHPLVYEIVLPPNRCSHVNAIYRQKREAVDRAQADGDWNAFVWLHERPHRCEAFLSIADRLPDKDYWAFAGAVWQDSENIWQNLKEWRSILRSQRPAREHFMSEEDRIALAEMADRLTVYRGIDRASYRGLSWTLDKSIAEFFAMRFNGPSQRIVEGTVSKSRVIAYLSDRGEQEIVALPQHVRPVPRRSDEDN